MTSLDKYKSYDQRRRRMSSMAPMNARSLVLDFEGRIAICKIELES
jgi:DNA-binding transcriptional regulator/RsmH inhibitor MraZ